MLTAYRPVTNSLVFAVVTNEQGRRSDKTPSRLPFRLHRRCGQIEPVADSAIDMMRTATGIARDHERNMHGETDVKAVDLSQPRGRIRGPLVAVLVCVGCLIPFVNKAFFIDDPLFLWAAQHIQRHPLDPYGFDVNWYVSPMRMADVTKNPPLACYFLAAAAGLFGWSEIALHLAFLLPTAGVAWGTYRLAEGLCGRPLLATLAGVLTPVFLISSTSVMCDTLMLCFWVWAIVCWRRGLDQPGWLIVSAVLISLCALTKYFGVSLIPLLLVYTLLARRRVRTGLTALLIPIAVLAAYQLLTHYLYGRGLLLDAAGFSLGVRGEYGKGWLSPLIGLAFTGGCLASVLFYLPLLWPRRIVAVAVLVAGGATFLLSRPLLGANVDGPHLLQAALFLLGGCAVAALAVDDWRHHGDAEAMLLLLWTAGTLAFAIGVNWVINGRSLLPLAPVTGLLIARQLDRRRGLSRASRDWRAVVPLLPAAVVALLAAAIDYRQADVERAAARCIAEVWDQQPGSKWLEGHWGFQYYLQQLGGTELDQSDNGMRFRKGDFLALPGENTGVLYEPDAATVAEVLCIEEPISLLGCTMNRQQGAGFYSHDHGSLPFVFGPAPPVRYRLLRFLVD